MENRKFIILLSIFLSLTFCSQVFAYEIDTHAFLTNEVIDIYNQNFSGDKISVELGNYLIDGSRKEDDDPRYLNHFYDPVKNRGLSEDAAINPLYRLGNWQASRDWAKDENNQNKLTYKVPATIASILSAFEQKKIGDISSETDFTWQKAIDYWIKGEKEKSMFALGHVLHLIEDVSVPDHTRNDPHALGSPYEKWTEQFTLANPDSDFYTRIIGKKPIVLDNLESYFNGLAVYSNNNFYSKDTIGIQSGYKTPEPDYFDETNTDYFGFKKSNDGDYYLFAYRSKPGKYDYAMTTSDNVTLDNNLVLRDYWNRLSVKSVQYGAGVINLFFQEVEKEKNQATEVKEEPKSFFASTYDNLKNFFNELFGRAKDAGLKLAAVVDLNKNEDNSLDKLEEVRPPNIDNQSGEVEPPKTNFTDEQDEDAAEAARIKLTTEEEQTIDQEQLTTNNLKPVSQITKSVQVCKFSTDKTATRQNLLINEVAWMGSFTSANDEWFELKNISGNELDISGWQVLDKNEDIKITFGQGIKVVANGFLLLERTDDDSVPGTKADVIYSGALSNSDEGLRLFDNECNLVDEVVASSEWPGGIAEARRAMERQSNLSWNTYGGNGEAHSTGSTSSPQAGSLQVMGTPKKENGSITFFQGGSVQPTNNQTAAVIAPSVPAAPSKILISEIQITGGTGKTNNDFIELYNPNAFQVNLNGYRLVKRTKTGITDSSIKSWTSDTFIPAKGHYLWANSDYSDIAATPDIRTSATLANDNGIAVRFGAEDTGTVIDSVGWGASQNSFVETQAFTDNPVANQSISRKTEIDTNNNSADFVKSKPTPKNSGVSGGFLPPDLWSAAVASSSHIVISEFYADRTGVNKDFVELYNPNAPGSQDIDISGWSLQVLSANATSTDKITKKNFVAGNKIPASGFFLIGIDDYVGADMTWASGSLNSSDGATIFLVSGTTTISDFEDSRIIDQVAYGSGDGITVPEITGLALAENGKSWERRAYQNSSCLSAQSGGSSTSSLQGEFLGNGCDTDNNAEDFDTREISKPQGLANFIEPRNAPLALQNFTANYSTSTMDVFLNWDASQDYLGATSTIIYELSYATSTSSGQATSSAENLALLASATGTTTHSFKIKEVGIGHYFSIVAKDKEGLSSLVSSANFSAMSPLKNLYFYKDTRATTSKKYLLDFYYDNYPFIPDVHQSGVGGTWKIAVFYLNKEAPEELVLNVANNWQPTDFSSVLAVKYETCAGSYGERWSLILPDAQGMCNNGGGIANSALDWDELEDRHLLFEFLKNTDDISFTSSDYISIGMYSFYTSGAGDQVFKLAALDRNKYYFQNTAPVHQSPSVPANLELSYNSASSLLRMVWNKSIDADTLDGILKYQINYSDSGELNPDNWIAKPDVSLEQGEAAEINGRPFTKISVEPEKTYIVGVRAVDDFGNISNAVTGIYTVPPEVLPYGISDVSWGYISDDSVDINFDADSYPFMTAGKPSAMIFFFNQNPPTNYSFRNDVEPGNIRGDNKVLALNYLSCGYSSSYDVFGGLILHNETTCTNGGWGLKKDAVRSDLAAGQTNFISNISGVLGFVGTMNYDFTENDYITIGFYELSGSSFQQVGVSNTKVYFQPQEIQ